MYNQNFPGYPNNNNGFAYGVARPQPSNSQPLTQEIADMLRQENNAFNMKIDQRDIWRSICTHRDPTTGAMTLAYNPDGSCTCSICGETFTMYEGTADDVEKVVNELVNIMQTAKVLYMDAPRELTEQYYQMLALLAKLVALYKHALNNFAKYENVNNPLNPISGNYSGFNALGTLLTAPYMYQQPMMNPQMAQPMMAAPQMMAPQAAPAVGVMPGQPMMAAPMYADPNVVGNPMAYGNPMMVQPPMVAAPQAAAPAAPAPQNNEVQQQKVYNV